MKGVNNSSARIIKKDSIVITTRALIGNICINKYDSTTNQGCHSLINNKNKNEKFYYYYMNSIKDILLAYGKGTTFIELSKQGLEDIYVVDIPTLKEQNKIANYLDKKTLQIDTLISKIQEQIELLKKAKQKLITEVATGKIDVTNL
jgi:type I restriction enzyme S subunit